MSIPNYGHSVRIKMRSSKTHLENLLAIRKWASSTLSQNVPNYAMVSSTITTGSYGVTTSTPTFPMGNKVSVPVPSEQTMNVSMDLDGLFECLASSLDIFAQIVNLTYFNPPRDEGSVSFDYIIGALQGSNTTRNEPITRHLANMKLAKWYAEMKPFRRTETHRRVLDFKISYAPASFEPLRDFDTSYDIKAILISDNPLSTGRPTYVKKRKISAFCTRLLRNELKGLDKGFEILEIRIRTSGRVPI
jgi:hypothetical protein